MSALQWVEQLQGPGGVVAGIVGTKLFDRSKNRADAAKVIADTAVALLAPLNSRVDELTTRVSALETENTETKSKLRLALDYIRDLRQWIFHTDPDKTPPTPPAALNI